MASDPPGFDRRDERGVVGGVVAAAIGAILVMVALVLDLSGARRDRDADQVAAAAQAGGGASGLGRTSQQAVMACGAASS